MGKGGAFVSEEKMEDTREYVPIAEPGVSKMTAGVASISIEEVSPLDGFLAFLAAEREKMEQEAMQSGYLRPMESKADLVAKGWVRLGSGWTKREITHTARMKKYKNASKTKTYLLLSEISNVCEDRPPFPADLDIMAYLGNPDALRKTLSEMNDCRFNRGCVCSPRSGAFVDRFCNWCGISRYTWCLCHRLSFCTKNCPDWTVDECSVATVARYVFSREPSKSEVIEESIHGNYKNMTKIEKNRLRCLKAGCSERLKRNTTKYDANLVNGTPLSEEQNEEFIKRIKSIVMHLVDIVHPEEGIPGRIGVFFEHICYAVTISDHGPNRSKEVIVGTRVLEEATNAMHYWVFKQPETLPWTKLRCTCMPLYETVCKTCKSLEALWGVLHTYGFCESGCSYGSPSCVLGSKEQKEPADAIAPLSDAMEDVV